MISPGKQDSSEEILRSIAKEISNFRREFMEQLFQGIVDERDEVVDSGFDPCRGRGRGPMWADGG